MRLLDVPTDSCSRQQASSQYEPSRNLHIFPPEPDIPLPPVLLQAAHAPDAAGKVLHIQLDHRTRIAPAGNTSRHDLLFPVAVTRALFLHAQVVRLASACSSPSFA